MNPSRFSYWSHSLGRLFQDRECKPSSIDLLTGGGRPLLGVEEAPTAWFCSRSLSTSTRGRGKAERPSQDFLSTPLGTIRIRMEDSQKSKPDRFAIESLHIRRRKRQPQQTKVTGGPCDDAGPPVFAFPEPVRFRDLSSLTQKWKPPTPRLTGQQPRRDEYDERANPR